MRIHQLSLFLENKAGQLQNPCRILGDAGINIHTLTLADTQQFGIMRLIVSDWAKAKKALEEAGCVVNVTEVLAIDVKDRPGGLADMLAVIEEYNLNVEYVYAFPSHWEFRAVLIFCFEDSKRAEQLLPPRGITIVSEEDIMNSLRPTTEA